MEGPIPALLKALGQVPPFPYGEKPIPTLLKVLGQVPPFPYGERPIPALLERWDRLTLFQCSKKRWDRSPIVHFCNFLVLVIFRYFDQNTPKT